MTTSPDKTPRKFAKDSKIGLTLDVLGRIIATYVASALAFIGGGALLGVDVLVAASLGGLLATFKVIEKLALAYIADGKIDRSEIDTIFSDVVRLKNAQELGKK
jgi:hypothetical protein|tara:strand:+ start:371 stop:682 length:312 start_codon:yes stop_codon:yes gene_type:complete